MKQAHVTERRKPGRRGAHLRWRIGAALAVLLGLSGLPGAPTHAQPPTSGLSAAIALTHTQYLLDDSANPDPIEIVIALRNVSGRPVIVSQKIHHTPLHLLLVFTDPDGKVILANEVSHSGGEGLMPTVLPINGALVQVDEVEVVNETFTVALQVPNARAFYTFLKAGMYTVRAYVPVRTYDAILQTVGGVQYAAMDAPKFEGVMEANTVQFALVTDADHDGYASPVPDSRISAATQADCNDANPAVHPGAAEIPATG